MSDSLSAEFPSPPDLDEIRERFTAAFVQGRFFPEGHECSPYVRLANDVQPLLREVERLRAGLRHIREVAESGAAGREALSFWWFGEQVRVLLEEPKAS